MPNKFVVAPFIARLVTVIGWCVVFLGAASLAFGASAAPGGSLGVTAWILIGGGVLVACMGLALVCVGESMAVLYAIEANTRRAGEVA